MGNDVGERTVEDQLFLVTSIGTIEYCDLHGVFTFVA